MMRYRLVVSLGGLTALIAMASIGVAKDDCDCRKWPWKPSECYDVCAAKALSSAKSEELTKLGLAKDLAEKVIEARPEGGFSSLKDLKTAKDKAGESFSKEELLAIDNGLKSLPEDMAVALAARKPDKSS